MQQLNYKHPFFLTTLILCGFSLAINPYSAVAKEKKSAETTVCVLKTITTIPEQELVVERGKGVNVTVKLRCKGDIPAVGVTVGAVTLKGKKAIELSPASAVTDEYGRATFTVTGDRKTEEDLAEIKFTAGELATKLAVKVRRTECKLGSIRIDPEKDLILEQGKSVQVTVKVKCENGSPAVDAKVDALVQSGSGKIDLSPSAGLTDAGGKAVFTVTGVKETIKEPATIRFTVGDLKASLDVRVRLITGGITPRGEATPKEEETPKEVTTPEVRTTPQIEATPKEEETPRQVATPEVKITPQAEKSTETTGCVLKTITTIPEQELVVERGKGVNVTVKLRCKGDIPAVGVTVGAVTLKGKKAIELSPASAVTDEYGRATFTVTGDRKTEEDLAEIKFTAGELATKLAVKVRKTECKPGSIRIDPEKDLILEQGKSVQVTVKVKCENGSPAVDAKVDALVQSGSGKIDLSPSAGLTDAGGKAVFTVTGVKETIKEPATIKFTVGDLKASLDVRVRP